MGLRAIGLTGGLRSSFAGMLGIHLGRAYATAPDHLARLGAVHLRSRPTAPARCTHHQLRPPRTLRLAGLGRSPLSLSRSAQSASILSSMRWRSSSADAVEMLARLSCLISLRCRFTCARM